MYTCTVHRVSIKTVKIVFIITLSNFHQLLSFLTQDNKIM